MGKVLHYLKIYPLFWGVFLTLIPIAILIYKRRRLEASYRFLLLFLCAKFLSDVAMLYTAAYGMNNLLLHNLFVPLRYFLLSKMFAGFLESGRYRRWINISVGAFLILALGDVYFSNTRAASLDEHLYVRYSTIVECILMLLWILLYFYEVFKSLKISNLLKSAPFLIAVAWLLYYASTVFFAPLFYYIYRAGVFLDLGIFEYIPDFMDVLSVLIVTVATAFIPRERI